MISGSIVKPAFLTVSIISCSVIPSDFTVNTLSLFVVSTSQWQMPSALSKCGFTDATQPPQLIFVWIEDFYFPFFYCFRMLFIDTNFGTMPFCIIVEFLIWFVRFTVLLFPLQPQAVSYYTHATQCHCCTCNHRV